MIPPGAASPPPASSLSRSIVHHSDDGDDPAPTNRLHTDYGLRPGDGEASRMPRSSFDSVRMLPPASSSSGQQAQAPAPLDSFSSSSSPPRSSHSSHSHTSSQADRTPSANARHNEPSLRKAPSISNAAPRAIDNLHDALPAHQSPVQPSHSLRGSRYPGSISGSSNINHGNRPSAASYVQATQSTRSSSPLPFSPKPSFSDFRVHQRKHTNSQGSFEPSLSAVPHLYPEPSNTGLGGMELPQSQAQGLSASQIAAQAAMQHQNHQRKRSQTLPVENTHGQRRPSGHVSPPLLSLTEASGDGQGGVDASQEPPASLQAGQIYRNGLLAGSVNPAATAANIVFARSPQKGQNLPTVEVMQQDLQHQLHQQQQHQQQQHQQQQLQQQQQHSQQQHHKEQHHKEPEKPAKTEKSRVKLFSRPGKLTLGKEKDSKDKPLGSPSKLGYGTSQTQKANLSTHSLADSSTSSSSNLYSLGNSSSTTIRAVDSSASQGTVEKEQGKEGKEGKEKKHHHFLSRQKQKLSGKDDHHLPLSSASSNSRPVDPHAPSSFYNFNIPPSPGPATTSFSRSMSGLDLRHGGRALREKKREEKSAANHNFQESIMRESDTGGDWPGPSSLGTTSGPSMHPGMSSTPHLSNIYGDLYDLGRYGLNNMSSDDAWPLLNSKILAIFQGEDLRLPIEDLNRLVSIHIQRCIAKRAPNIIIDDLRDLLKTGFISIDDTLRRTADERLVPHLVEMWLFVFTSILPYLQAVFLPLDLEFEGQGSLMNPASAREFWGALPISSLSNGSKNPTPVPAHYLLSTRRLVLTAYRDIIILPRFELLQAIFSRLSLESINLPSQSPINPSSLATSSPDLRPGTAASLDPPPSSYSSQSTTLLNGSGAGSDSISARSRGVSNVSFNSDQREAVYAQAQAANSRPYTSNRMTTGGGTAMTGVGIGANSTQREVNAEDSKHVTDTVGRMLQCMSVLAAAGIIPGDGSEVTAQRDAAATNAGNSRRARGYSTGMVEDEGAQEKMDRLCRSLKLNWLGRGRTGRNRRGLVGGRMKLPTPTIDVGG